jgi:RNA polymerase sigma-70 factor (ECF subfamily)
VRDITDADLVRRAQRGDQRAFARLASAAYGRLHAIAHGVLRDRERADDAIQQALLDIWRELPRLRDPGRFDAWSYRLVVHACYAETRAARRSLPNLTLEAVDPAATADDLQVIVDRDQLERGFRRLSVDHRAVLVLSYYLDLSAPEVADALGVPLGTVHSRMHHAIRGLRAALESDARSSALPHEAVEGVR